MQAVWFNHTRLASIYPSTLVWSTQVGNTIGAVIALIYTDIYSNVHRTKVFLFICLIYQQLYSIFMCLPKTHISMFASIFNYLHQCIYFSIIVAFSTLSGYIQSIYEGIVLSRLAQFKTNSKFLLAAYGFGTNLSGTIFATISVILLWCDPIEHWANYGFIIINLLLIPPSMYLFKAFLFNPNKVSISASTQQTNPQELRTIMDSIWTPAYSQMIVFMTTLTIFPSLMIPRPEKMVPTDKYFIPIGVFFNFSFATVLGSLLGGLLGRYDANWINRLLFPMALSRLLIMVPIFIVHYVFRIPNVFISILIFFVGLSSATLQTLNLLAAHSIVPSSSRHIASLTMAFALVTGLTLGSGMASIYTFIFNFIPAIHFY